MATKTFEGLKQLAIQIRDEKTNKQNTATRVGTAMLEGLNKLEQDYYDKTATNEKLKERDDKLTELEEELSNNIDNSQRYLEELTLSGEITNHYINKNGEIVESNGINIQYVKVGKGEKLKVVGSKGDGSIAAWAFFLEEPTEESVPYSYQELNVESDKFLTAPENGYAAGSASVSTGVKIYKVSSKTVQEGIEETIDNLVALSNAININSNYGTEFTEVKRVNISIKKETIVKCQYKFSGLSGSGWRVYANDIGGENVLFGDNTSNEGVVSSMIKEDVNVLILYAQGIEATENAEITISIEQRDELELDAIMKSTFDKILFSPMIYSIKKGAKIYIEYNFTDLSSPGWRVYANDIGGENVLFGGDANDLQGTKTVIASRDIDLLLAYAIKGSGVGNAHIKLYEIPNYNDNETYNSPYQGKTGIILGDSHAINRAKWAPKIFDAIGATFDEETSSIVIREANSCGEGYEKYGDPFYAQAVRAVEQFNSGKVIDIILAENVHYNITDEEINTAYPLIVKNVIDIGELSVSDIDKYFSDNISTILNGKEKKLGTMIFAKYSSTKYELVFSGTPTAGECSVILEGQTFNATVENGDTLNDVVNKLGIWSFGDYTDWSNSVSENKITLRYKGEQLVIPQPNVSFNAGGTGLTMQTNEIASYINYNRYFSSYDLNSDWENPSKWMNINNWAGYSGLKGFYETLLNGIPHVEIICIAFPCYNIQSGQYKTELGVNMYEFYNSSFYAKNRNRALSFMKAGEYYNAKTIDVEKLCNVTLNNWFEFNPSGDVHPKNNGYERWADTVIKELI